MASHLLLPGGFQRSKKRILLRKMPKTKSERNTYTREWRKSSYKEKRFNKPLREFMELKYRDTYNEYCWFYRSLDEQHPSSKDLTKTVTYKNWKRRQLNCESSDDETKTAEAETEPIEAETEPIEAETELTEAETEPIEAETEPIEAKTEPTEAETEPARAESDHPDILSVALEETLPPGINSIDINQIDNIIQQVINELEQEEAVRELLNNEGLVHPHYQDEDEGIDLDVESELEAIMEPFDYELEVEGVDY